MSTTHFPAIGHVYEANFGSWVFHLHFVSETVMILTNVEGPLKGTSETVQITVTPIRPGVFMICWQEADKTTVVHIEDFENRIVHTNITEPNGVLIHHSGTTHSWDCIEAFQKATSADKQAEGFLIRLESKLGDIVATSFDERRLGIATREHIEVR